MAQIIVSSPFCIDLLSALAMKYISEYVLTLYSEYKYANNLLINKLKITL
jgi:hypothetical protein